MVDHRIYDGHHRNDFVRPSSKGLRFNLHFAPLSICHAVVASFRFFYEMHDGIK